MDGLFLVSEVDFHLGHKLLAEHHSLLEALHLLFLLAQGEHQVVHLAHDVDSKLNFIFQFVLSLL